MKKSKVRNKIFNARHSAICELLEEQTYASIVAAGFEPYMIALSNAISHGEVFVQSDDDVDEKKLTAIYDHVDAILKLIQD